jgi:site-specific DNA-methyltransferase (adenine-specific)
MLRFNKNVQGTRDSDNYKTPESFYNALNKEFKFDFDPCPFKHDIKKWDGLKIDWKGSIFVNPPYSQIELWLKKGIKELKKGNATDIVYLIPLRTDSWYWHHTILKYCKEVRFVRGRLNFGRKELSPFPVCLVVFNNELSGEKILTSYEKEDKIRYQKTIDGKNFYPNGEFNRNSDIMFNKTLEVKDD